MGSVWNGSIVSLFLFCFEVLSSKAAVLEWAPDRQTVGVYADVSVDGLPGMISMCSGAWAKTATCISQAFSLRVRAG